MRERLVSRFGRSLLRMMFVVVAAAGLVWPASAAQAHEVAGAGATNFRTTLSALAPAVPGVSLSVVENGSRLEAINTTDQDLIVQGYTGEPFAKIGPGGVFVNDNSPATYLNTDRYATTVVPAGVDGKGEPRWRKVSGEHVYRWHDHRIHWMLKTLPAPVAADPGAEHRVSDWKVVLDHGGRTLTATGALDWIPGPSPTPWLLLAIAIAVVIAVGGLFPRLGFRLLAAGAGLMLAADLLHSAGVAAVETGSLAQRLGALLGADATALVVWPFGILAAWRLAYRSRFAAVIAACVGALLGFSMALDDAPVWWRSSAPTGLSMTLDRATVSTVIGAAAGLVVAVALMSLRSVRQRIDAAAASAAVGAGSAAGDESAVGDGSAAGSAPAGLATVDGSKDDSSSPVAALPAARAGEAAVLAAADSAATADRAEVSERADDAGRGDAPHGGSAVASDGGGADGDGVGAGASGVPRRSVAGYLAVGGVGVVAGTGIGIGLRSADTPVVASAAGPALSDVGAGRVAYFGSRQSGIAVPTQPQAHSWVAAFDLLDGVDAKALQGLLRQWSAAAARMAEGQGTGQPDDHVVIGSGPCALTVTFGFGPSLFGKAGIPADARPAALAPLPAFTGDRLDPAASHGDLGVIVAADDPLVVFHAARVLRRIAGPVARLRWGQTGFAATPGATAPGSTGRNLMGQVDGTNNPKPADPDFATKVFVSGHDQPAWLRNGSYLVVRRIRMILDDWDGLTLDAQQKVIGRRKDTGAPLSGGQETTPANYGTTQPDGSPAIPVTAHIRLAAPAFNNGAAMLRRGWSYSDGDEAGLLFLAYQADPRRGFIPVQQRLAGNDALSKFIRHEASALFAIPGGVPDGGYVGQDLFAGNAS
ncbi:deferrochelatase/peroxidase EfeB [Hamadaea flava]|uniref:Dyp-type peroxidase n=1 Tax=Hamadaea flava TaxID=1742688 RepID=A0ABV8LXJ4_9ACTN|nr:Dyp-type peroxidase [Hamadaea flava]MCP2329258.1 deferrochelatase/peroxidase EfeB [Hamadaea flava]